MSNGDFNNPKSILTLNEWPPSMERLIEGFAVIEASNQRVDLIVAHGSVYQAWVDLSLKSGCWGDYLHGIDLGPNLFGATIKVDQGMSENTVHLSGEVLSENPNEVSVTCVLRKATP